MPRIPPGATFGRRWRARRDWVIAIVHAAGVSQRMLGDVFDLPCSRIAQIVKRARGGTPPGPG